MNPDRMNRGVAGTAVAALLALVAGACGSSGPTGAETGPTTSASAPRSATTTPAASTGGNDAAPTSAATPSNPTAATPTAVVDDPERLVIERIGVNAPMVDLGLTPDGALEAPTDWDSAGWWTDGPHPGHIGPAVVAGHVDSKTGPAVFARLGELRPGDLVKVVGRDGTTVTFTVDDSKQFPKDRFPTVEVYGPTTGPALRLITCGGDFDTSSGHYIDNVVVSAHA